MAKPQKRSWFHRFIWKPFLYLFIAQLVYIVALKWVDPPITMTQLGAVLSGDGLKRDYISGPPVNIKLAVIAAEDQLFPDHRGFDWKSIEKAQAYNKRKPGRVRGASTISQQTAKNVFLWQGRSWIRKGLEVYFTKMIEWIWGKERILEVYVNVIEMGRGVYGVEAAAQHYFNKPAAQLTRREAALIAACLPNPKRFQPGAGGYVQRRAASIQANMNFLQRDGDVRKVVGLGVPKEKERIPKLRDR
ncbi:MAG: monofunctional biosynthetic peptidoglycan transglycosylase [Chitinophagaceae bacterium]|nr:MAG: monofunctional biosynthetic peptidoglycan transglycosylase [Chitinophagaceae bacterium]